VAPNLVAQSPHDGAQPVQVRQSRVTGVVPGWAAIRHGGWLVCHAARIEAACGARGIRMKAESHAEKGGGQEVQGGFLSQSDT